jgi:hypothetical protein
VNCNVMHIVHFLVLFMVLSIALETSSATDA